MMAVSAGLLVTSFVSLKNAYKGRDELHEKQTKEARERLKNNTSGKDRAFDMATIAKYDFNKGNIAEARKYGTAMLEIVAKATDKTSGDYGVAVHDGNVVMGRIALREKHVDLAKKHLLAAGKSPGSPTLDSFGPNMELANDLIEAGERDTVIAYFHECESFWDPRFSQLKDWAAEVKAGKTPYFGANMSY